jgi:hypothetical protein
VAAALGLLGDGAACGARWRFNGVGVGVLGSPNVLACGAAAGRADPGRHHLAGRAAASRAAAGSVAM